MAPYSVGPTALEGAPVDGSESRLENYASTATPPPAESRRSARYRRRSGLWKESSLDRVKKCGRVRRAEQVGVRHGPQGAGFSGVCTCGSVWADPVCNAKIMARRSLEVGLAIAAHQGRGGRVIFQTLTLRHHRGQTLPELWDGLLAAWRSMSTGKAWAKRSASLGLLGWLRAVEVTWSARNGWHVHIHALLFVGASLTPQAASEYGTWSAQRWARAVVRQGLAAPLSRGQHVRLVTGPADGDLGAYLSKATDLGMELTQSQGKTARQLHSTVPAWALLTDLFEHGDAGALDRWHQWEAGSKGRRQMTWSRGLRDALGLGEEMEDEQVAEQEAGDEDLVLITPRGWDEVVSNPWMQCAILEAAERSPADLRALLTEHGVEFIDPGAAAVPAQRRARPPVHDRRRKAR